MKLFTNNSLSVRLILILITAIVSINFILAIYTYNITKEKIKNDIQSNTASAAKRLANSLIFPIWNLDYEEMTHVLRLEFENKHLSCVLLYNEENQLIKGLVKDTKQKTIIYNTFINKKIFFGNLLSKHEKDIMKDGSRIGKVEVYVSDFYLNSESKLTFFSAILQTLILSLFLIAIIYISIKFLFINRLSQLQSVIINLENFDNPDIFRNIDTTSHDEIGLLGKTIKSMSDKLFTKNLELHKELKSRKNTEMILKKQNKEVELANAELAETIWLIESQNSFNDLIVSVEDFSVFCRRIVEFIADKLSAPVVNLLRTIPDDNYSFELLADYGSSDYKQRQEFGFFNQVIKNKTHSILKLSKETLINLPTSSGDLEISRLLIYPIEENNGRTVILEIGSINDFTTRHINLLKGISRSITITFENLSNEQN